MVYIFFTIKPPKNLIKPDFLLKYLMPSYRCIYEPLLIYNNYLKMNKREVSY